MNKINYKTIKPDRRVDYRKTSYQNSESKKLSAEQRLVVDLAKPISNYAIGKLISFFIRK